MSTPLTRAEHLEWAKGRALGYVNAGDLDGAYDSILIDLGKHPDTQGPAVPALGKMLLRDGQLDTAREMRAFIEGIR